jgi:hypothetical protein
MQDGGSKATSLQRMRVDNPRFSFLWLRNRRARLPPSQEWPRGRRRSGWTPAPLMSTPAGVWYLQGARGNTQGGCIGIRSQLRDLLRKTCTAG